jgi:hypothetical protein
MDAVLRAWRIHAGAWLTCLVPDVGNPITLACLILILQLLLRPLMRGPQGSLTPGTPGCFTQCSACQPTSPAFWV